MKVYQWEEHVIINGMQELFVIVRTNKKIKFLKKEKKMFPVSEPGPIPYRILRATPDTGGLPWAWASSVKSGKA